MKYKAKLKIESEFECSNPEELEEKMWASMSEPLEHCVFDTEMENEELKYITLTDDKGNVIDLNKQINRGQNGKLQKE